MSNAELTLDECEAVYMDGCADAVSGDVEAPTGHFYRVDNCIVATDDRGFKSFDAYEAAWEAADVFASLDEEYGEWLHGDDDDD